MATDDSRTARLAANLKAVRERIAAACDAASREASEIHLIVVTKTYPAADVMRLASLGVADIGENRDQEAAPKAVQVAAAGGHVRWHFVGRLQSNKCRSVAAYADMVHSVDRVRLAETLDRAASREDHTLRESVAPALARTPHDDASSLDVLVQVSLDGDTHRGGAVDGGDEPDTALARVLDAVASADGLRLRGLMAVAPQEWEPERAFAKLAAVRSRVCERYPEATVLSAGMSGDLEHAIMYGATHVRVGSAVLGERSPLR